MINVFLYVLPGQWEGPFKFESMDALNFMIQTGQVNALMVRYTDNKD